MYCKKCYSRLTVEPIAQRLVERQGSTLDYRTAEVHACNQCGRRFDPNRRRTFLRRQFPSVFDIAGTIIVTTLFGAGFAFAVALHQMAAMSGH